MTEWFSPEKPKRFLVEILSLFSEISIATEDVVFKRLAFSCDVRSVFFAAFIYDYLKSNVPNGTNLISSSLKIIQNGDSFDVQGSPIDCNTFSMFIFQQWLQGRTIAFNHMQNHFTILSHISQVFYKETGLLMHFNAYWTPPNSEGAGEHADEHDVIVLQCYGRKLWYIHHAEGERRVLISNGDILFLKAGVRHRPVAQEEGSLHLTVGLIANLPKDRVLRALSGFASADVSLPTVNGVSCFLSSCSALFSENFTKIAWRWTKEASFCCEESRFLITTFGLTNRRIDTEFLEKIFEYLPSSGGLVIFRPEVNFDAKRKIINFFVSIGAMEIVS